MIVEAEFMRAVLCAVAGARWLPDSGLAAPDDVTAEVRRGLNLSVPLLRAGYLEVEAIQRMKIAVAVPESGLVELDADPALERSMLIKVARPRTDRFDETRRQAFASIKRGVYECAVGMVRIAHGEIDDDGLPSFEEFSALCDWMVVGDWGIAEPILWLLLGDIYFGATIKDDTVVVPDAQQLALLTHHSNQLARPAGTAGAESVVERIQALTLAELDLACIAIGDAFRVHNELVFKDEVVSDTIQAIARMTGYIQSAVLGSTKEVAAEQTAYLYNRDAQAAGSEDEAEQLFAVAMGCAHYARQISGHNRHAKYIAQNLLEIAHLRVDASLRALAESIWIDAYATPLLLGHFATDTPFEGLGWSNTAGSIRPRPEPHRRQESRIS